MDMGKKLFRTHKKRKKRKRRQNHRKIDTLTRDE